MDSPVHITSFQAERFKRIQAVFLQPTPDGLTVIGGRNGSGKTSILDAITFALGGGKYKPSEIRHKSEGSDSLKSSLIHIELSNGLIVERKGTSGKLTVTSKNGLKGGQMILDEFVEELALNLPKFLNSNNKQKADTLLKIIGLDEQLDTLNTQKKEIYAKRTDAGNDADRLEKELGGMEHFEDAPETETSSLDILNKIDTAQEANIERSSWKLDRERSVKKEARLLEEIAGMKEALVQIRDELSKTNDALSNSSEIDIDPLTHQLENLHTANEHVKANQRHETKRIESLVARKNHDQLQLSIENVRDKRSKLLDGAKMPLDEPYHRRRLAHLQRPGMGLHERVRTTHGRHLHRQRTSASMWVRAARAYRADGPRHTQGIRSLGTVSRTPNHRNPCFYGR